MEGSRLERALADIYIYVVLAYISVHSCFPGHFLVYGAFLTKLVKPMLEALAADTVTVLKLILQNLLNGSTTEKSIIKGKELQTFCSQIKNKIKEIPKKLQIARLWILYADYINTVKMFITAKQTGNWNMYFLAGEKMLNLLKVIRDIYYAKGACLYQQLMKNLPAI